MSAKQFYDRGSSLGNVSDWRGSTTDEPTDVSDLNDPSLLLKLLCLGALGVSVGFALVRAMLASATTRLLRVGLMRAQLLLFAPLGLGAARSWGSSCAGGQDSSSCSTHTCPSR